MTRAHAARQLLQLGPLTFGQFVEITGWLSGRTARHTLEHLIRRGEVRMVNVQRRRCYVTAQVLRIGT